MAKAIDYDKIYKQIAKDMVAAKESAFKAQKAELKKEVPKIKEAYDEKRSSAYQNARLSAIGNNETLAAAGLAGALYDEAKSGVSETSRIAQDNALRNSINALNAGEVADKDAINREILTAENEKNAAVADALLEIEYKKIASKEKEQERQDNLTALAYERRQTAVTNALKEVATFGKVMTKSSAKALGVPIGTTSYEAQIAMQSAKGKSSRRSSSGSRSTSSRQSKQYKSVYANAANLLKQSIKEPGVLAVAKKYRVMPEQALKVIANSFIDSKIKQKEITESEGEMMKSSLGIA